jgi:hypothetical protein
MARNSLWLMLALASTSCADHITEVGSASLAQQSDDTATLLPEHCMASKGDSPDEDALFGIEACIVDSAGNTLSIGDGPLPVLPAAPPYGLIFRLNPELGIALSKADFSTKGSKAAIKVYAAPYNLEGWPSAPDGDESKRLRVRAVEIADGGLLVRIDDPLPVGTQVAIELQHSALLANHHPLPAGAPCSTPEECELSGYTARFYVGAEPPIVGSPPTTKSTPACVSGC